MEFLGKSSTTLSIFTILLLVAPLANSIPTTFHNSLEAFSQNLFREIVKSHGDKNIIYSPLSIQTALAMVRMGADGETATEMDHVLGFKGQTIESIADSYHSLMMNVKNSNLVTLANKIYLQDGIGLQDSYKDILNKKFFSSAESINFGQRQEATNAINNWVESKTNGLITDLVGPNDIDASTRFVLLNAIHFKGGWLKPFEARDTETSQFYIDETKTVNVQMMTTLNDFEYARFENLDATAVRLPYNNSDLSMLIFLPNSRTGLAAMQEKLMKIKLETLTPELDYVKVFLDLPKFKVEFAIELTDTLRNLGMSHLVDTADLGKMLKSSDGLAVTEVLHKAIIDVNEMGTEAAVVTSQKHEFSAPYLFSVDHPFYYAIVNADNVVLFQGNVVTFDN